MHVIFPTRVASNGKIASPSPVLRPFLLTVMFQNFGRTTQRPSNAYAETEYPDGAYDVYDDPNADYTDEIGAYMQCLVL